jgi:hypothetical protein
VKRTPEWWLKLLLRLWGAPPLLAIVAFVMPHSWMAAVHAWLGMSQLPDKPILDYLARYASAFSVFYGVLLFVLASDVYHYARLITVQAVMIMAFSAAGAVFGLRAGMPTWWMATDVASCWLACGAMLWLQRRIARQSVVRGAPDLRVEQRVN